MCFASDELCSIGQYGHFNLKTMIKTITMFMFNEIDLT